MEYFAFSKLFSHTHKCPFKAIFEINFLLWISSCVRFWTTCAGDVVLRDHQSLTCKHTSERMAKKSGGRRGNNRKSTENNNNNNNNEGDDHEIDESEKGDYEQEKILLDKAKAYEYAFIILLIILLY